MRGTLLLAAIACVSAQIDSTQHAALMNLFDATGCGSFCPRFSANEACPQMVVVCEPPDIKYVFMSGYLLNGTIPSTISALTALSRL